MITYRQPHSAHSPKFVESCHLEEECQMSITHEEKSHMIQFQYIYIYIYIWTGLGWPRIGTGGVRL